MTDAHIIAGTLTANVEERVVSGLLLPYGEVGQTNLGKFAIDGPGVITIPQDVTVLMANEGHSQTEPRARFLTATESEAGVYASFKIGSNPEGDTLLAKIEAARSEGKPMALSAEVKGVIIKAGKALGGMLTGAAFVDKGAFPSAALMAAAVDTEEDDETPAATEPKTTTEKFSDEFTDENGVTHKRTTTRTTTIDGDKTTVVEKTVIDEPAEPVEPEEESTVTTAIPGNLAASAQKASPEMSFQEVMRGIHAAKSGMADATLLASLREAGGPGSDTLFAALSDVKYSGTGNLPAKAINPFPMWIGELWSGLAFVRDVVDVLGTANLTARTIAGWKWDTKPQGGAWAGNKSDVPSNVPTAVPYNVESSYWAGAHDHANEYRHFPNPEYWESYYAAMRESYARWSNAKALADLKAAATVLVGDAVPATTSVGLSLLIDGAVQVVTNNALPTYAFVEPALYKGILKTPHTNALEYLDAALGFDKGTLSGEGFKLRPKAGVTGVIVGAREAATFYELGETPIRIEAEDLVKGGLDTGLFGYAGTVVHKADAIIQVNKPA
jgi:hypothetical protein